MSCRLHVLASMVSASGICLLLVSLSWQYVLLAFTLAAIGWAVWSWRSGNQQRGYQQWQSRRRIYLSRPQSPKVQNQQAANIYQFPFPVSEAAE